MVAEEHRALSTIESVFAIGNVVVTFVMDAVGEVNVECFREALGATVASIPLMNAAIVYRDDQYRFVSKDDEAFPFRVVDIADTSNDLDLDFQHQMNIRLPIESHLWDSRLVCDAIDPETGVTPRAQWYMTIHHAICDGASVLHFVNSVWENYGRLAAGETVEFVERSVRPGLETLLAQEVSEEELDHYIATCADRQKGINTPWLGDEGKAPDGDEFGFRSVVIDEETTAEFAAACKARRLTPYGGSCAVILNAIYQSLGELRGPVQLVCHSAVDLRRRLNVLADEDMVCAVGGCPVELVMDSETDVWSLARTFSEDLRRRLKAREPFFEILALSKTWLESQLPISLAATNLGRQDFGTPAGKIRFQKVVFVPLVPAPIITAAVMTVDGRMNFGFPYHRRFFREETIEAFLQAVREGFKAACVESRM